MPAGPPTKFKSEYIEQAEKLCLLGATEELMADFFNVTPQTIQNWKKKHPELFVALKKAKVNADAEIASSLYHRAKGYEWDEQQAHKIKQVTYNNGKRVKEVEHLETIMVHKVVPPDTTAAIFWLKNRQREQWREKNDNPADDQMAGAVSITYYPEALPRGYYERPAIDIPNNSSE